MRRKQLVDAGLIPNHAENEEEGESKNTGGSVISKKKKQKK